MQIQRLEIQGFRNIESERILFSDGLNVVVGDNAQGKTSLVESIFLCAFGKSFRAKDHELIHHNHEYCYVKGYFKKNGLEERIEYSISRTEGKRFQINGKRIVKMSDLMERVHVVLFSPDDLRLVKDGPANRRTFLNREISGISRVYFNDLVTYNQLLKHRNALLKTTSNPADYGIWNERVADVGCRILLKRLWFLNLLGKYSENLHKSISAGKEQLSLQYQSTFVDLNQNETALEKLKQMAVQRLESRLTQDIRKGFTSIGPHVDDFDIEINGLSAKAYASQGQQRTAALSLKLSEIELLKKETGEYPIVLLDDILSELDKNRQNQLMNAFGDAQVLLTTAENVEFGKILTVKNGKIV